MTGRRVYDMNDPVDIEALVAESDQIFAADQAADSMCHRPILYYRATTDRDALASIEVCATCVRLWPCDTYLTSLEAALIREAEKAGKP